MNFGGLKCTNCGGELELSVARDGMSEEATRYDKHNKDWGWVVSLECPSCNRVYELCRTPDQRYISPIRECRGKRLEVEI